MAKEIGTVSQKYRRIELALQKATPAKVKELVKEMIQETLPMFEEGRNPTILKWAKNKWKKHKDYKVYVYKHRDLIYNN